MQRFTSSRSGTLVLGGLAALAAGALLLIYVSQVRQDANSQSATVSVLVANKLIPQNSSGDVIASQKWYTAVSTPKDQVKDGAITDPASISGKIASHDIYPNQQMTTSDFTDAPTDAVTTKLTKNQRAISIPLDSAAGLTPFLQAGDHVDIMAGFNVIPIGPNGAPLNGNSQARPVEKVIAQDIKVLEVPSTTSSSTAGSSNSGNIVVQVTDQQAWDIAFAINNGTVFLAGAPQAGIDSSKPGLVTLETMLLGIPPVKVYHSLGGR
ncbi:MAG TPA: Flp pilus assembly protein CpaB [Gaiellales bacterium]|nr:Flp pilus assembly protein CpaB [Gaiellales bacterium]